MILYNLVQCFVYLWRGSSLWQKSWDSSLKASLQPQHEQKTEVQPQQQHFTGGVNLQIILKVSSGDILQMSFSNAVCAATETLLAHIVLLWQQKLHQQEQEEKRLLEILVELPF